MHALRWVFQNPPPDLLAQETEKNTEFALALAHTLPRVTVAEAVVTALGDAVNKISIKWRNEGFLSTHGSQRALETKAVRAKAQARVALSPAPGKELELVVGTRVTELPHLAGRSSSFNAWSSVVDDGRVTNPNEGQLEWVVKGEGEVHVTVDWQRAGTTTTTVRTSSGARL